MSFERIESILSDELARLDKEGLAKGREAVITGVIPSKNGKGPRLLLEGEGDKPFLRMNSNSYLGMSLRPEIVEAEEVAVREFGTGPGAVRFISGTSGPHIELERRLAAFHKREAAMIFSSAYATIMGVLPALISPETAVISDALNHNCIINAVRLALPGKKAIYPHLDMAALDRQLERRRPPA